MSEYEEYCKDCKQTMEIVMDYRSGDTICVECGAILEAWCVDERSEWRIFAADSGGDDGPDPNRVGGPINPLLEDGPLKTFISKQQGGRALDLPRQLGLGQSSSERHNLNLVKGFEAIANMSELLGLAATSTITSRASEIFKKVEDEKTAHRFNNRYAIFAACLYISCKQEGKKRTLKEICSVSNGVISKEIVRAAKYIAKLVPSYMEVCPSTAESDSVMMMSRFGSHLGLKFQAVKAAQETVGKSEELDIRRNPVSIAAAVIYMISQLSEDKKSLNDVSAATRVAPGTIRATYNELHPYASKIVPTWFTQTMKV